MSTPSSEGKTTAIITYITVIGLIIGIVMNSSKKDDFATYHIRNMIGLCLFAVANAILSKIGIPILPFIIGLGLFVLWLLGFLGAIQGEKKEIPLVGALFQDWFKGI